MKKKILSLVAVFMMIAGTSTSLQADGCVDVTLSCNVSFEICNYSGTSVQLINAVLHMNNSVCGTNFELLPLEDLGG